MEDDRKERKRMCRVQEGVNVLGGCQKGEVEKGRWMTGRGGDGGEVDLWEDDRKRRKGEG